MESLLAAQSDHEKRFNCIVCMEAKLDMVYGICQHRLCSSCLYLDSGALKPDMNSCPVCAKHLAFPQIRPNIPEDNIEMQKYLGVRECLNKEHGCKIQLWDWEMEDHVSICQFEKPYKPGQKRSARLKADTPTVQASKRQSVGKRRCRERKTTPRRSARISGHS